MQILFFALAVVAIFKSWHRIAEFLNNVTEKVEAVDVEEEIEVAVEEELTLPELQEMREDLKDTALNYLAENKFKKVKEGADLLIEVQTKINKLKRKQSKTYKLKNMVVNFVKGVVNA